MRSTSPFATGLVAMIDQRIFLLRVALKVQTVDDRSLLLYFDFTLSLDCGFYNDSVLGTGFCDISDCVIECDDLKDGAVLVVCSSSSSDFHILGLAACERSVGNCGVVLCAARRGSKQCAYV